MPIWSYLSTHQNTQIAPINISHPITKLVQKYLLSHYQIGSRYKPLTLSPKTIYFALFFLQRLAKLKTGPMSPMHKSHPFKAQDNIYLAIFKKPVSQVQGKTILSMGFNSIIKAHVLNPWQIYFINGIQIPYPKPMVQTHGKLFIKSPI